MESDLRLEPVPVLTGSGDEEGVLALAGGRLVAVLVRLADDAHGERVGEWFLEAGFGPCAAPGEVAFHDLDTARGWLARRLGG